VFVIYVDGFLVTHLCTNHLITIRLGLINDIRHHRMWAQYSLGCAAAADDDDDDYASTPAIVIVAPLYVPIDQ